MNITECSLLELKCQDRHTWNLASTCSKSQIIFIFGKNSLTTNMQAYEISMWSWRAQTLPAYYRESCLDFSDFSSALAVCVSTWSKPNLTHRFESHCKNNKFSSKRARFTWIFCQYCPILTFERICQMLSKSNIYYLPI